MFPKRRITLGGDVFRDEYSLDFDGSNDYVDTGHAIISGTGDYTFIAWIKKTTTGTTRNIAGNYGDGGLQGIQFGISSSEKFYTYTDETDPDQVNGTSNIPLNVWTHVASTRSSNSVVLYINGVSDATGTLDNDIGADRNFCIGADPPTGAEFYTGKISDVAVYNTALSSSQIKTLYNGREPYNHKEGVASSSLIGWWRMGDGTEGGTGTTIYDMSANSNNGTMTNMSADDFTGDTP